ncbi:hypothetical protein D9611_010505 [Ephemerocybe angulata]|uniref:BUB1 N-terminal domain-containing protein n=1 Tax=Ephemerocybe angulata TaxID=980116 RepID=A0A8H5FAX4_9AGAR|nr:hypothetical protein D9611_010505 [Tulosesus angulatus]
MDFEDEIHQEQEPVVVDFDLLEAAKENVQPLATGRRVTALSALLATPHSQREGKLLATRNRLRINVELALDDEEDGDPLEAFCRLVYWTLENYPQGHSAESGLLELLEEATRVLKDYKEGVYRGDLKYLKLWLLYASYVDKPTIIYRFLEANEIGAEFALLYEEHAAVLERDGRKKEADEVYSLGIARKAQPLDHLKARYDDFQKRMMTNMSIPVVEPPTTRTASSQQPVQRQALATTSTQPSSSSRTLGSGFSSLSSIPSSSSSRLQIFVDPTGEEGETGSKSEWNELESRKTRVKENVPETKKLEGTTIKQIGKAKRIASSSRMASSSSSKIVPYRDTEADEPPPPATPTPANDTPPSSRSSSKSPADTRTEPADTPERTPAVKSTSRIGSGASLKGPVARGGFAPFVDTPEPTPARTTRASSRIPSSSSSRAPTAGLAKTPAPAVRTATKRVPSGSTSKIPVKGSFTPLADTPDDIPAPYRPNPVRSTSGSAPKVPAKASFTPFVEPSKPKPASTSSKAASSRPSSSSASTVPAKGGFAPFVDAPEEASPPAKAAPSRASSSNAASKAPIAKGGFAPFVDAPQETPPAGSSAAPPKFTPFRDEDEDSKATAVPVGDSVIKVKKAGLQGPALTTEAEALRKDPLKNYGMFDAEGGGD